MDYFLEKDGVKEQVALERWGWGVMYKDGTELHQFGSSGDFHQFKEIDLPSVELFVMYRTDVSGGRIDLPVSKGTQIFHFYRTVITQEQGQPERRAKVYVFGWKHLGGAHYPPVTSYNYILPNDRIITADHDIPDLTKFGI